MNKMVLGHVDALLKDNDLAKKGNFLGKAKAFASKLSSTFGSEDESIEVDLSETEQLQKKKLFDGESKKEKEARLAAEAAAKKKTTTMIIVGVAVLAFMLLKKK